MPSWKTSCFCAGVISRFSHTKALSWASRWRTSLALRPGNVEVRSSTASSTSMIWRGLAYSEAIGRSLASTCPWRSVMLGRGMRASTCGRAALSLFASSSENWPIRTPIATKHTAKPIITSLSRLRPFSMSAPARPSGPITATPSTSPPAGPGSELAGFSAGRARQSRIHLVGPGDLQHIDGSRPRFLRAMRSSRDRAGE